ncbi:MAG TPA: trypsin-like peptidase domain-containing protein [Spirochaetota bacterium]|nr:trypsin-like peptidase domain-containing protein [Spirochaetota bacterium]
MMLPIISLAALLFSATGVTAGTDDFNAACINAADSVRKSVVSISIYEKKENGKNGNYRKVAYGSGTIIDDGYVVTNYHVVMKGDYFQVLFNDGVQLELEKFQNGKYYLADQKTDIALLKIRSFENTSLRPVVFADSNRLSGGEWVLAIGNPYGLRQTITSGIVSSKGRDNIGFADIEDFIQTDVSINPGNSGGPLINLEGKLVGINTAIRSDSGGFQGISFAIPSNLVKQVCRELIRHGRVRRGWIGFLVKEEHRGLEKEGGYLKIISVIRNSPAESAGLLPGDIIRKVDGERITTLGSLIRSVGNKPVGTSIDILLARDGHVKHVSLVLRERMVYKKIRNGMNKLFMRYGIEIDENSQTGGVIISDVSPKSIVYNLQKGDIILSVDGKRVNSLDSFIRIFYQGGSRIGTMTVSRDSRVFDIQLNE